MTLHKDSSQQLLAWVFSQKKKKHEKKMLDNKLKRMGGNVDLNKKNEWAAE